MANVDPSDEQTQKWAAIIVSSLLALWRIIATILKKRKKKQVPEIKDNGNGKLDAAFESRYIGSQYVNVVLVEDSQSDLSLIQQVLGIHKLPQRFEILRDGVQGLDFLFKRGAYETRPPLQLQLIILDINLPRVSGLEVLKAIKSDDKLKTVPVVMFTGSVGSTGILEAYALGANSCVQKPVNFDDFRRTILAIRDFWLGVNLVIPTC